MHIPQAYFSADAVTPPSATSSPQRENQLRATRRWIILVSGISLSCLWFIYADSVLADSTPSDTTDWVPMEQLSPEQKKALPPGCCGAYIEPHFDNESANVDDITISGEASQVTKQSTLVTGDVILSQGQRRFTSDSAELFEQDRATLHGHVTFRESGVLLQGEDAEADLDQSTFSISNARYVLHESHIHGEAEKIERDKNGVVTLTNGSYSSCTPDNQLWYLKSSSMVLDPNTSQGTATHVRLDIMDVPIFYFPYLQFPIGGQRQSGFLAPSFSSGKDGAEITLPYYLNLAPAYDATLTPRYIADRGAEMSGEFRHLAPYSSSSLAGSFLSDQLTGENRWLESVQQTGGQQEPWSTGIDFTRVSDRHYFEDLSNTSLSVSRSNYLKQQAMAGYMTDHWDTKIEVEEFQVLRDSSPNDAYKKLPELGATGYYALGEGFSLRLGQSYAKFEQGASGQTYGDRLAGDYQLDWRKDWQAGFIEPALNLHYLEQQLENTPGANNPKVTIPSASLDMGLIFQHENTSTLQTLEPRLYYYYADYKNQNDFNLFDTNEMDFSYQQIFADSRFSGSDRIGDANQTSLGLTSRWLDRQSGKDWLQLSIGKIFYRQDRRVYAFTPATFALLPIEYQDRYTENQSPYAGELLWRLNMYWRLSSELVWNEKYHHTQQGNVFLHYGEEQTAGENNLFSIGYRHVQLLTQVGSAYLLDTVEEGEVSTYWPLNNQWGLIAHANHDFSHARELDTLAGFQYENCCWRLRAVYRQWATNPNEVFNTALQQEERGVFLEFQLKNLVGIGPKMDNLLRDSIYGYKQSEHTN